MTDQAKKYLSDILHALELIEKFTVDITDFNDYLSDLKTQSAVERQLGIIGEAVNNYDKRFPNSSLKFAKSIVGFRNRLIHAYDAIDATIVWAIINKHLAPLKNEVISKLDL